MSNAPAPHRVVDCTYVELVPAVRDETGKVIRPPVIKPPDEYDAPLDGSAAVSVSTGEPADLADLGLEPVETLEAWTARHQDAANDASAAAARATAAAWVDFRMIRDRWLDQLQVVFDAIAAPSAHDLPAKMLDGIASNGKAWLAWRQAMRDLPEQPGLDPVVAVAAIVTVHATTDTWPAPWPQPPAAPVKHLT
jgi:hypothetical protein